MPCSSQDIFAWTGAVLINIGFIFGIAWGTFTTWYIGAALTAVYSALLFGCARGLEKRQQQQDDDEASNSSNAGGGKTLLISLLYGLAILAMGVTGFFIPMNVIGTDCFGFDSYSYSSDQWMKNTSGITSPSVLAWMEAIENDPWGGGSEESSFVYLPDIDTTVFSGISFTESGTEEDKAYTYSYYALYTSTAGAAPQPYTSYKDPGSMVAATGSMACFRAAYVESITEIVGCYDGATVQRHAVPSIVDGIREVRVFDDDDEGIVWYRGYPNEGEGRIFVSLDVNSNTTTVHSVSVVTDDTSDEDHNGDCGSKTTRLLALCLLFASAIPVFVVSVLLWRAKSISSTGLTSLVGFIAAYSMLVTVLVPSMFLFNSYPHAIGWLICGAVYGLFYLPVAVFDQSTPPLRWGAVTASVSYLTGLCFILFFLRFNGGTFLVSWIVFFVVGSVPLSILGLVSDSWFMTFLGAGVAFASSIRLCVALGDTLSGGDGFFLIVFVSLAVTGLLVGGVGYMLGKYKRAIKQGLASALSPLEHRVKAVMGRGSGVAAANFTPATAAKEQAIPVVATSTVEAEKGFDDVEL